MSTLVPPSASSSTEKTMSNSYSPSSDSISDCGRSSPDSATARSPLISCESSFNPSSHPLNFLVGSATMSVHSGSGSGDYSSAEDSLFSSTPPSSHDSPSEDWAAACPSPAKQSTDSLWAQPEFASFPLDSFPSVGNMDFSLGFDSVLFPNDPLFSLDSSNIGGNNIAPTDFPSYAFSFGSDGFQNLTAPATDARDRRSSPTSSSSSSGLALSPLAEPTQANPDSGVLPSDQPQHLTNEQFMDELAARARQIVGLTMALPKDMNASHTRSDTHQVCNLGPQDSNHSATSASATPTDSTSSSPAPAISTRTKTSHTTIERRYRTNLNARIQSLRAAVPALRILEVKAGNRVGNLSLKAGTRRVGVDPDAEPGQEDVIDERGYIDGVKVARKGSKANVLGKAVEYIHVLKRREMRLKREQEGLKALVRSLVGGPELVQQWETMWREQFGGPEKDEVDAEDGEADEENDDEEDGGDADDQEDKTDDWSASAGRKRKRVKVDSLPSTKAKGRKGQVTGADYVHITPQATIDPQPHTYSASLDSLAISVPAQPEKKKRGRPRKVPSPPAAVQTNNLAQNVFAAPFVSQSYPQQTSNPALPSNEMKMEVDAATVSQMHSETLPPAQTQSGQQYLLAAFAFFSFFNSPLSYSTASSWSVPRRAGHAHTHFGSVLQSEDHAAELEELTSSTFGWRDAAQLTHLVVSVLLLFSIVSPWLPRLAKHVPRALKPIMGLPSTPGPSEDVCVTSAQSYAKDGDDEEKVDAAARSSLLSALHESYTHKETHALREALGLGAGMLGLLLSLVRRTGSPGKSRSRYGLERRMLEQKAFLRLAELIALNSSASTITRLQIYLYSFKLFSIFSASSKDVSTLALVILPILRGKSASLWSLARSRAQGKMLSSPHVCKAYETYVLEIMTVDDAFLMLSKVDKGAMLESSVGGIDASRVDEGDILHEPMDPLAILARQAVRDFIRAHIERIFLQTVTDGEEGHGQHMLDDGQDTNGCEMRRVVEAGHSLDSRTTALVDAFERVCDPTTARFATEGGLETEALQFDAEPGFESVDAEICALLRAVVLYRRIFPSTLLSVAPGSNHKAGGISVALTPMPSPPPSPSRRDAVLHLALRRCLDSAAFDRGDELEDARDHVVDMLTAECSGWPKRLQNCL